MKLFTFSILIFSILFIGCVKQEPIKHNTFPNVIVENKIHDNFSILQSVYKTQKDGLILVEVEVQNISSAEKTFTYKVDWKDENGFKIKTIMSRWVTVNVEPSRNAIISTISPSLKAKQYIVHIVSTSLSDKKRKNSYNYEYQNQ